MLSLVSQMWGRCWTRVIQSRSAIAALYCCWVLSLTLLRVCFCCRAQTPHCHWWWRSLTAKHCNVNADCVVSPGILIVSFFYRSSHNMVSVDVTYAFIYYTHIYTHLYIFVCVRKSVFVKEYKTSLRLGIYEKNKNAEPICLPSFWNWTSNRVHIHYNTFLYLL